MKGAFAEAANSATVFLLGVVMAATLASVEVYLTAAQSAFNDGDNDEARKQILLGEMELLKLPVSTGDQGSTVNLRAGFKSITDAIIAYEKSTSRGTRRSYIEEI